MECFEAGWVRYSNIGALASFFLGSLKGIICGYSAAYFLDFLIIIWGISRKNHASGVILRKITRNFACSILGRA
jgi:hypothetical protein